MPRQHAPRPVQTTHKFARLPVAEYIRDYRDAARFIQYCKACDVYGKVWVCPPYGFDTLDRIKDFRHAQIIGTQVFIDEAARHTPADAAGQKEISYRIMREVRRGMDWQMLELEKKHPGSLAFFAGGCFLCREEDCTRRAGKECRYPAEARSSLEAYGFDIAKTASRLLGVELKWSEKLVLPEYFTLVSALFTNHDIDNFAWELGEMQSQTFNLPY